MSGLLAAVYLTRKLEGKEFVPVPSETMMGSIVNYICSASIINFAPMNANFGIMLNMLKDREQMATRSLEALKNWIKENL